MVIDSLLIFSTLINVVYSANLNLDKIRKICYDNNQRTIISSNNLPHFPLIRE